jgi:hypothetical protein
VVVVVVSLWAFLGRLSFMIARVASSLLSSFKDSPSSEKKRFVSVSRILPVMSLALGLAEEEEEERRRRKVVELGSLNEVFASMNLQ